MKWWIIIGLLLLVAGYAPRLRTRYTPLPAIQRAWRRGWAYQGPRWTIAVAIVRVA